MPPGSSSGRSARPPLPRTHSLAARQDPRHLRARTWCRRSPRRGPRRHPGRKPAPPAGQDDGQRPCRLRLGQDPLGQADLPAPRHQLHGEPYKQAEQCPDRNGRNGRPQSARHRRSTPLATERPDCQGYEADRRPDRMRQRAAPRGLGIRRDQHARHTTSDQDQPPGDGSWPERQARYDIANAHRQQHERHHPPVGGTIGRQGADGARDRIDGARLQPGSNGPPADQKNRSSGR
jgi:hypothetical protein